jgi:cysteine synthase
MVETYAPEHTRYMKFLGARVILTPAADLHEGMVAKADDLAKRNGWFR